MAIFSDWIKRVGHLADWLHVGPGHLGVKLRNIVGLSAQPALEGYVPEVGPHCGDQRAAASQGDGSLAQHALQPKRKIKIANLNQRDF